MAGSFGDLLAKAGLAAGPPTPEPAPAEVAPAVAPAGPAPLPAKLALRYGKKQGSSGKATRISGLVTDHAGWLKRLQSELGVGGRVDGDEIVLQGDQVERVARWFESQGVAKVQR
ncbi:MAG: translation initiation factor [Myxococcota bacterium]